MFGPRGWRILGRESLFDGSVASVGHKGKSKKTLHIVRSHKEFGHCWTALKNNGSFPIEIAGKDKSQGSCPSLFLSLQLEVLS